MRRRRQTRIESCPSDEEIRKKCCGLRERETERKREEIRFQPCILTPDYSPPPPPHSWYTAADEKER